jgi:hypothetical protein
VFSSSQGGFVIVNFRLRSIELKLAAISLA